MAFLGSIRDCVAHSFSGCPGGLGGRVWAVGPLQRGLTPAETLLEPRGVSPRATPATARGFPGMGGLSQKEPQKLF